MPGTILLKGFKEFGIEPIRPLDGQGFADTLGDFYWFVSSGHNKQSLQGHRSLGKLRIRPHSCATPIDFNNDIDFYNDNAILCLYDVRVVRLGLCVPAAALFAWACGLASRGARDGCLRRLAVEWSCKA